MRNYSLNIEKETDDKNILKIGIALSSPIRIAILKQVNKEGKTLSELAKLNFVSFSSIVFHTKLLEEAKLVQIKTIKTNNGSAKLVIKGCVEINVDFDDLSTVASMIKRYHSSVHVGDYTSAEFGDNNGFVIKSNFHSFYQDSPFLEERRNADLIYTNRGFVEYSFDNTEFRHKKIDEISFSLEICSEVPYFNNSFESLIGFSINGIEAIDFISPGDFGGRRGRVSPSDSSLNATQYGQLKTIVVNDNGVYLDGVLQNANIKIQGLNLDKSNRVLFRITSKKKDNAYGGFNIFGKNYGDYPQDIEMDVSYEG